MARIPQKGRWIVRPIVVLFTLLTSLDLFLVGLVLVGRPANPMLNERFAAEAQAQVFNTEAERSREQWARFRERLEQRAAKAR